MIAEFLQDPEQPLHERLDWLLGRLWLNREIGYDWRFAEKMRKPEGAVDYDALQEVTGAPLVTPGRLTAYLLMMARTTGMQERLLLEDMARNVPKDPATEYWLAPYAERFRTLAQERAPRP